MNGEARLPAGSGPRAAEEEKKMQPSLEHAARLLLSEIQWVKEGEGKKEVETYRDIVSNRNIKLTEKVLIPIKQHPKFNFVGKLLGPQGNSLKRLQAETGTKMSILGKGCMRDKTKEEELRRGGEGKYFHLREELHVLIEVFAPPGEAYARMGHALKEVKKFLVPDYNDEIRQEQLRELTFLNGSSEHTHCLGRGRARGRPIHNLPPPHATTAVGRARGGTFIGPAGLLRHLPLKTRCIPLPRMVLGTHVPSISGPRAPPQHHVPPPTPNSFSDYLYCDGYPGAVEQLSYDVMNNSYCAVPQSAASIYDFELEDSEATTFEPFIQWEAHNTSYIEPWPAPPRQLKAPASRGSKGSFRDHPYGQF